MADNEYDSGEDLFITQSSFKTDTQGAETAADFLESSFNFSFDIQAGASGELVEYMDFSKEQSKVVVEKEDVIPESDTNVRVGEEVAIPLIPDTLFTENTVAKLSDEVVSAAMDDALASVQKSDRFGKPVSDTTVHESSAKGYSDASKKKAKWAYNVFFDWKLQRNLKTITDPELKFIGDIKELSVDDLVYALKHFLLEVRKKNGEYYPNDTLYDLFVSLQMYLHMAGRMVKFFDDSDFQEVIHVLDNQMKFLASQGYCAPREKAETIDIDDEEKMWQDGVLGDSNPKQLVDTLLYSFGVHFALRAVKEHKSLRVGPRSQFSIKYDRDREVECEYLEYTEDSSKNNQGGLRHRRVQKKVSRAYPNTLKPERCVLHLYRKYLSLRPTDPRCPEDFYLRPLAKPRETCWYMIQPMGIHKISTIVNTLARQIGVQGKITNHSCRATCASRIYQGNCDEQLVMEKTGHRSNAVRSYKRTSNKQLKELSNLLYGEEKEDSAIPVKRVRSETVSKPPDTKLSNDNKEALSASVVRQENENVSGSGSKISFNVTINLNK